MGVGGEGWRDGTRAQQLPRSALLTLDIGSRCCTLSYRAHVPSVHCWPIHCAHTARCVLTTPSSPHTASLPCPCPSCAANGCRTPSKCRRSSAWWWATVPSGRHAFLFRTRPMPSPESESTLFFPLPYSHKPSPTPQLVGLAAPRVSVGPTHARARTLSSCHTLMQFKSMWGHGDAVCVSWLPPRRT
jgi:hypothetical protein